ncbi:type II toxin-antitoxin system VapC family toxin [Dolichospermum sp. LEGE 00240]|jgi:predicted nucleic acid-binding protein|uniref:type II toxin-antitoxin system VapC family toxin n=1 Tax=Dolichospermum sp. LEGE 00240 TaxID=1828603 RepID=UPI00187EA9FF|nr:type II toxin-antitoxin system VapC family toxin [Dolichospermum sp. LEGE 00240]MBE9250659.1 type II toxin-antitoxin system VapC family toxin [Dolichospermum sp. LEGE 00240]MDM3848006.1 type II toxin-antitoxin system VapC family toxin [Aphanizomenon gracile PMC638.10]MDM3853022.1 type II toxin-antitoxin system VapC family toxin [Aphanizomenon gracile PMC627.10]MDM3862714.1 type II toxin-antitoxin system VapC family toxin [Aphanizomenon gracile PMC644.10]
MIESLYLDTSVIGYLIIRPSTNLITASNSVITQNWWDTRRQNFTLYISEVVLEELARGDQEIATKRLELISELPLLAINEAVEELAQQFLIKSNLPPKASDDALHIALATVYKVDYLLTWNCKHIANAQIQKKLSQISIESGYELPTICTPYELMGD